MKKLRGLSLVFLMSCSLPILSDVNNTPTTDTAIDRDTLLKELMEVFAVRFADSFKTAGVEGSELQKAILKGFMEADVATQFAAIFDKHFSLEELKDLVEFYKSSIFKKTQDVVEVEMAQLIMSFFQDPKFLSMINSLQEVEVLDKK